jgi:hypothetical protein
LLDAQREEFEEFEEFKGFELPWNSYDGNSLPAVQEMTDSAS